MSENAKKSVSATMAAVAAMPQVDQLTGVLVALTTPSKPNAANKGRGHGRGSSGGCGGCGGHKSNQKTAYRSISLACDIASLGRMHTIVMILLTDHGRETGQLGVSSGGSRSPYWHTWPPNASLVDKATIELFLVD